MSELTREQRVRAHLSVNNEPIGFITDVLDVVKELDNANKLIATLQKDGERLEKALERIGFFFAGQEPHQHIADKILLVLGGKTIEEAIKSTAP